MKGEPIQDVVLRTGADRLIRCITRDEAAEEVIDALLSGRCRELLSILISPLSSVSARFGRSPVRSCGLLQSI
jgi:hypothetical protein